MPVSFAKVRAERSLLCRLDARTKLAVTVAAAVLTVTLSGLVAQLVLFVASLVYVLLLRRPMLTAVLYGAMALMMGIALLCGLGLSVWLPAIGDISVKSLVIPFLRGLTMMNTVMALALSTRIEDLLSTLERTRMPFCLFLPAAVMLRFIPTFTADIRQVWETLRIKGWPLGPAMLTRHPLISARLIMAPILFRALKSSETLGVAAELKGLGAGERTVLQDGRALTSLDACVLSVLLLTVFSSAAAQIWLADLWMTSGIGMP